MIDTESKGELRGGRSERESYAPNLRATRSNSKQSRCQRNERLGQTSLAIREVPKISVPDPYQLQDEITQILETQCVVHPQARIDRQLVPLAVLRIRRRAATIAETDNRGMRANKFKE